MKILVGIKSKKPNVVQDAALRWVARGGYNLKLFIPSSKYRRYQMVVDDANYHWYLDLKHDVIESILEPEEYAIEHNYDLLLTIPEDLKSWRKGGMLKEKEIFHFVKAVGKARLEFGRNHGMRIKKWSNGAVMRRVK
jgi:hypothetical protein